VFGVQNEYKKFGSKECLSREKDKKEKNYRRTCGFYDAPLSAVKN
jgi:hypothetical protein